MLSWMKPPLQQEAEAELPPSRPPVPSCGPGPTGAGPPLEGQSTAQTSVGSPGAGWGQQLPAPGPLDAGAGRNTAAQGYWSQWD